MSTSLTPIAWFGVGLFLVAILAMYAPKIAGGLVILIALVLGIRASQKKLV